MEQINGDPMLRERFMHDFAKDRVEKLQKSGYLSSDWNKSEMEKALAAADKPVNIELMRNHDSSLHPSNNPIPTDLDHYQISRHNRN